MRPRSDSGVVGLASLGDNEGGGIKQVGEIKILTMKKKGSDVCQF